MALSVIRALGRPVQMMRRSVEAFSQLRESNLFRS